MSRNESRSQLADSIAALAGQYTAKEIAVIMDIPSSTVRSIAQNFGISMAKPPKLDDHDASLIRQLRGIYGLKMADIAEKFEVSISLVAKVCKGISKHHPRACV